RPKNRKHRRQTINIGTHKTRKMKDTLNLIKKQAKTQEKQVITDERRLRPKDVKTLITDNSKAKKLLGWKPKTTLQEGIRKTIQWYLKNGELWGYEKRGWPWRY
ncbi:GDP-mannose 4,6-dehydratase, partial [Candidatus Bathyarchaeota archaeon]|nr:GDP-mannose 4,6-dehydratase [Candidatus Bathyarchaeota archaeon]